MKKYLAIIAILACSVSCLKGSYHYSYKLNTNFETSNSDKDLFDVNGIYDKTSFTFDVLYFSNSRDTLDDKKTTVFTGGFVYAYKIDSVMIDESSKISATAKYTVFDKEATKETVNHYLIYIQNEDSKKNPEKAVVFTQSNLGTSTCTLTSASFANTALAVYKSSGLVSDCEPLAESDYAKVTVTGYKGSSQSGSVEVSLIDKAAPLVKWTKADLGAVGSFDYLTIELTTSRPDIFNSFALDGVQVDVVIEY